MAEQVKIIECPRDAWQGMPTRIPAQVKAGYLRALIDAGFTHIDAVSFVSPAAVPQMADAEEVLELVMPPEQVEIIGIVVNTRGAERAIRTAAVQTLGFPYSISPGFLGRNQNQSQAEALEVLAGIVSLAQNAGLDVAAYVSMAFGNPYGEPWSAGAVLDACAQLAELGVQQVSLADTVGAATPRQIGEVVRAVLAARPDLEIGVHLHARRDQAADHIRAAYDAGCRRFDSALGGLGGCPFAQDALVGNIATETLIQVLTEGGASFPVPAPLDPLLRKSEEIAGHFRA